MSGQDYSFLSVNNRETLRSQQRPALGGRPSFPSQLLLQSKGPLLIILSLPVCLPSHTCPPTTTVYLASTTRHGLAEPLLHSHPPPPWQASSREETWKDISSPYSLARGGGGHCSSESVTPVNTGPPSPPLRNSELLLPSQLWPLLLRELCGPRFGQYTQTPQTHSLTHRSHLGLYFTCCRCDILVNVCSFRGLEALRTGTHSLFLATVTPRSSPVLTHMEYLDIC